MLILEKCLVRKEKGRDWKKFPMLIISKLNHSTFSNEDIYIYKIYKKI